MIDADTPAALDALADEIAEEQETAYREASRELVRHVLLILEHILAHADARQGALEMVLAYAAPVDPAIERRAVVMVPASRQAISKAARGYAQRNALPLPKRLR
jgi:hypothetical protein